MASNACSARLRLQLRTPDDLTVIHARAQRVKIAFQMTYVSCLDVRPYAGRTC